jgi:Arc/MetJ-type ribon-helix-helix transcriptional regulator
MISTHAADDFSELLEDGPAVGFVSKSELSREAIRAMLAERGDRLASSL